MWPWKRNKPEPPSDVGEAREIRAEAKRDYQRAVNEWFTIAEVTSAIAERRALNHFGDSIQITFSRRGRG